MVPPRVWGASSRTTYGAVAICGAGSVLDAECTSLLLGYATFVGLREVVRGGRRPGFRCVRRPGGWSSRRCAGRSGRSHGCRGRCVRRGRGRRPRLGSSGCTRGRSTGRRGSVRGTEPGSSAGPRGHDISPAKLWLFDQGRSDGRVVDSRAPEYQRLYATIRQLREERDLTQAQLGERLGLTQRKVSLFESGDRRLDVIELIRIAKALGVGLSELLDRAGIDHT
ncbi:XRE family transcriptional regulator [Jiangella ureilytica]|uniref:XRE family transcriptional regulator n=1 Tax=Jiangella ureilytica TaxID=2530374 RepID=A0A4R4RYN4_9ACTN|nr:XRE family transcriptional regulator [Jiangella ureilytica]